MISLMTFIQKNLHTNVPTKIFFAFINDLGYFKSRSKSRDQESLLKILIRTFMDIHAQHSLTRKPIKEAHVCQEERAEPFVFS